MLIGTVCEHVNETVSFSKNYRGIKLWDSWELWWDRLELLLWDRFSSVDVSMRMSNYKFLRTFCRRGGLCLSLPPEEKFESAPEISGKFLFSCCRDTTGSLEGVFWWKRSRKWQKEGITVSKVTPAYQEEQVNLKVTNKD